MSSAAPPTTFRLAKEEELEIVATLHAAIRDAHPISRILYVDSPADRKAKWLEAARKNIAEGRECIWILVRDDTAELVGQVCIEERRKNDPRLPRQVTAREGIDREEFAKISGPLPHFLQDLMNRYDRYIHIRQLDISSTYERRGMVKRMMSHVIDLAREKGLNVVTTAVAAKVRLYADFGFRPIGEPIMIGPDNTINGGTTMLLELFPPEVHTPNGH